MPRGANSIIPAIPHLTHDELSCHPTKTDNISASNNSTAPLCHGECTAHHAHPSAQSWWRCCLTHPHYRRTLCALASRLYRQEQHILQHQPERISDTKASAQYIRLTAAHAPQHTGSSSSPSLAHRHPRSIIAASSLAQAVAQALWAMPAAQSSDEAQGQRWAVDAALEWRRRGECAALKCNKNSRIHLYRSSDRSGTSDLSFAAHDTKSTNHTRTVFDRMRRRRVSVIRADEEARVTLKTKNVANVAETAAALYLGCTNATLGANLVSHGVWTDNTIRNDHVDTGESVYAESGARKQAGDSATEACADPLPDFRDYREDNSTPAFSDALAMECHFRDNMYGLSYYWDGALPPAGYIRVSPDARRAMWPRTATHAQRRKCRADALRSVLHAANAQRQALRAGVCAAQLRRLRERCSAAEAAYAALCGAGDVVSKGEEGSAQHKTIGTNGNRSICRDGNEMPQDDADEMGAMLKCDYCRPRRTNPLFVNVMAERRGGLVCLGVFRPSRLLVHYKIYCRAVHAAAAAQPGANVWHAKRCRPNQKCATQCTTSRETDELNVGMNDVVHDAIGKSNEEKANGDSSSGSSSSSSSSHRSEHGNDTCDTRSLCSPHRPNSGSGCCVSTHFIASLHNSSLCDSASVNRSERTRRSRRTTPDTIPREQRNNNNNNINNNAEPVDGSRDAHSPVSWPEVNVSDVPQVPDSVWRVQQPGACAEAKVRAGRRCMDYTRVAPARNWLGLCTPPMHSPSSRVWCGQRSSTSSTNYTDTNYTSNLRYNSCTGDTRTNNKSGVVRYDATACETSRNSNEEGNVRADDVWHFLHHDSARVRESVRAVFDSLPRDLDDCLRKAAYMDFVVGLTQLLMPTHRRCVHVAIAAEEWVFRGCCGNVGFETFFEHFFAFPFIFMRAIANVSEADYVDFWAMVLRGLRCADNAHEGLSGVAMPSSASASAKANALARDTESRSKMNDITTAQEECDSGRVAETNRTAKVKADAANNAALTWPGYIGRRARERRDARAVTRNRDDAVTSSWQLHREDVYDWRPSMSRTRTLDHCTNSVNNTKDVKDGVRDDVTGCNNSSMDRGDDDCRAEGMSNASDTHGHVDRKSDRSYASTHALRGNSCTDDPEALIDFVRFLDEDMLDSSMVCVRERFLVQQRYRADRAEALLSTKRCSTLSATDAARANAAATTRCDSHGMGSSDGASNTCRKTDPWIGVSYAAGAYPLWAAPANSIPSALAQNACHANKLSTPTRKPRTTTTTTTTTMMPSRLSCSSSSSSSSCRAPSSSLPSRLRLDKRGGRGTHSAAWHNTSHRCGTRVGMQRSHATGERPLSQVVSLLPPLPLLHAPLHRTGVQKMTSGTSTEQERAMQRRVRAQAVRESKFMADVVKRKAAPRALRG